MTQPLAAVVMAAGLGTRMKSRRPKHLHPLLGRPLVLWTVEAARGAGPERIVVVCSPGAEEELESILPDGVEIAIQAEPRGTGDAVAAARQALEGFEGDVLVLPGDAALATPEALDLLAAEHRRGGAALTLLSIEPDHHLPYGRIVRGSNGNLERIVEERDATEAELAIRELNSSFYLFRAGDLWRGLEGLEPDNDQGELYLTDTVARLVSEGAVVSAVVCPDPEVAEGVNTRVDLARVAAILRGRILERHMLAGATVVDPATTWVEAGVELEPDSVVHPFTVLRGNTTVREGAEVGPHVVAVDSEIGAGALVGPFAYLRPGTVLAPRSKLGTFVEAKNSTIGEGSKVPHLSYIGDAEIGRDTNIGAGAITANYRSERFDTKQRTVIGDDVHTGSQNVFVPPVRIGDHAWTGAGSVITEDVPDGALAIARARQVNKEDYDGERKRDD
ncbi:MAG TPA: bifunctional UDP-N-acetylglucosamine diphosphorylase/glucosamine-1-phosphate N-acetyltransferase GlmU [Gaiellaceae bacterium]